MLSHCCTQSTEVSAIYTLPWLEGMPRLFCFGESKIVFLSKSSVRFGFHRISPRELLSPFLGKTVSVDGIVTKCTESWRNNLNITSWSCLCFACQVRAFVQRLPRRPISARPPGMFNHISRFEQRPNFLLPVGNLSCANIETLPHPKECRQAQHTLQGCSKPNMNLREILWLFLWVILY